MRTADLDYVLPPDRIATAPAQPRDSALLMVVRRDRDEVEHLRVRDLGQRDDLVRAGDLMVFNRSRVIPARFSGKRVGTGGRVGGLYLHDAGPVDPGPWRGRACWRVLLESRGTLTVGETIKLDADATLTLRAARGDGQWDAELSSALPTLELLERIGSPPLPPYILQQRRAAAGAPGRFDDAAWYNTVYAADPGSVAAPTAGLHFTHELLRQLEQRGVRRAEVTLHVGLGTFAPVRTEKLEDHVLHREPVTIRRDTLAALVETRRRGARVLAVGTTTVRALESLPQPLPGAAPLPTSPKGEGFEAILPGAGADFTTDTDLFIQPDAGFVFRHTDALLTNFHLPRSTLLALVASLPGVGLEKLLRWYRLAIERGYRFYSYGDAMLIV